MRVKIEIDLNNAAFEENFSLEVREVLEQASTKVCRLVLRVEPLAETSAKALIDSNGNTQSHLWSSTDPTSPTGQVPG